jgi:hypothetical protein
MTPTERRTMTSTSTSTPATDAARKRAPVLLRVAAVLAALLAVTDVASAIPYWGNPMPVEVGIAIVAIAALTVVGAIAAFFGKTWGVWLAAVTRALSIAAMVPVFTEPGAPAEALVPAIVQIIVTVVVVVLLFVGLRKAR